jgi:putative LysE/RhtB family amino acid efflux pump
MILALVIGLVLGYVLSIPPGPIAVAVIKHALDGNAKSGMQLGLGASTMDTIYSLIAIFASTAIVGTLRTTIVSNPWILIGFQIAAVVTLVVLGFRYLHANSKNVEKSAEHEQAQEERAKKMGFKAPYLMGAMISIANLATPTFLPTLIGFAGYLHAKDLVDNSVGQCVLYAFGFGAGAALWFVTLLRVLYKWRTKLGANFISIIFRFAGWSFFLFAAILLVRVLLDTDWGTMFGG